MATVLRYPGGKTRMLPKLKPYLDAMMAGETEYCEPFMGGGSVGLDIALRYPKVRLFINDLDPMVSAFWRVVVAGAPQADELIQRLNVKPTVAMWDGVKASNPVTDVDKAFKLIFLNRTSFNGMVYNSSPIGGRNQTGKKDSTRVWLIDCQYNPPRMSTLIRAYSGVLAGRTTVGETDAVEFMRGKEAIPTFLDPPYFPESGENKLYGIQMPMSDHVRLANQMKNTAKWIMTYDFSGEVAKKLYFGVDTRLIHVRYSASSARKAGTWKQDVELVALHGFKV
jgi:DNA adenine methylase